MDITNIEFNKYDSILGFTYCEFIILNYNKQLAKFRFEILQDKTENRIEFNSCNGDSSITTCDNIVNFIFNIHEIGGLEFNINDSTGKYWDFINKCINSIIIKEN